MRILMVHFNADLYGASRSLLRLASRLIVDGTAVRAVLGEHGPLVEQLEAQGVEVTVQPGMALLDRKSLVSAGGLLGLPARLRRSVQAVRSEIRTFRPDLVHTQTAVVLAPGIAARR